MFTDWFPKGSLRRIVAGNTVSQVVGRVVSSVAILILSILIAKRYGPEGYGDFVKITTYVGFFYLIADFGLNAVYLQRTVGKTKDVAHTAATAWRMLLGLRLVISTLLVGVAIVILHFLPAGTGQGYTPLVRFGIWLLVPITIAQAITNTTNAFFQKILRYDLSTVAQNAGSVALLLFAVFLSAWTPLTGPLLGVVAVIAGSLVTSLIALWLVRVRMGAVAPMASGSEFLTYLRIGTPLGLTLIFNLVYFHSDSVVLTLTRSTTEVGIYGLAFKVFELLLVLPIFFMNSVYPLLLKSMDERSAGQSKIFVRSLEFLLVSSVVLGLGVWIGAPLVTLVRPDFAPSIVPLRILILGLPVFFVSSLFMWFLIARKQQAALLTIHGVAMLANIVLNIVFIPRYGYTAAAWITVISELFVLAATGVMVRVKTSEEGKE